MLKSVISASRRTDIPAFYMNWLIDGLKAGFLDVRNPIYPHKSNHVDLSAEQVEWIVFWSRNYDPLIKKLAAFDSYKLFFHFTVLTHHPYLEKSSIGFIRALRQAEALVKNSGADHLIWRYDPIILWTDGYRTSTNFCEKDFRELCQQFHALGVSKCYFSFVTLYKKIINRLRKKNPHVKLIGHEDSQYQNILLRMKEHAFMYQIRLYSCCNDTLIDDSIERGSCINGRLLNQITGKKTVSTAKTPTRQDCGCTRAIDIGDYNHHPCYFGCLYCYANPLWK